MQPIETIERIPLFSELPLECKQRLAAEARRRTYPAGATLAFRGDENGPMFALLSGTVKIHVCTEAGHEAIIALLGPGECVGELSVLDGAPRSADVTATQRTECLIYTPETVRDILKHYPDAAQAIIRALCKRIRENGALIESIATRDVVGRTAELLLRLSQSHGEPAGQRVDGQQQVTIQLDLTQSDIAACIGATRERVSYALGELRRMNYISLEPQTRRVIITRLHHIEQFVAQR